ncbi:hypothetical protein MUK42_09181 [Musa troglodytarum]|nr:hypothetical protein MUK42_09181 [Musa troglodytarum]
MAEKLIALGRSRQPWTFFTSTAIPISHASLLCSLPISPRSIPALGPSFRSISNQFILVYLEQEYPSFLSDTAWAGGDWFGFVLEISSTSWLSIVDGALGMLLCNN